MKILLLCETTLEQNDSYLTEAELTKFANDILESIPEYKTSWIEDRSKKVFYWVIYTHFFDFHPTILNMMAAIGTKYLSKYHALDERLHSFFGPIQSTMSDENWEKYKKELGRLDHDSFSKALNNVKDFAIKTSTTFSKDYSVSKELIYGLAAFFLMPYFYWTLFRNLKVGK